MPISYSPDQIKAFIKQGWTLTRIADYYGVTTAAISYQCKKHGIIPNNPKINRKDNPKCPKCGYPTYRSGSYYRCHDHGSVIKINGKRRENNNPHCPVCDGQSVRYGKGYRCKDCGERFKNNFKKG